MGCTSSQMPDPNVMYAKTPHKTTAQTTTTNGDVTQGRHVTSQQNGSLQNGDANTTIISANSETMNGYTSDKTSLTTIDNASLVSPRSDEPSRTLRGDLSQRQEARISREMRLKDLQKIREEKAQRISELVMEEKERLSLSTMSRSRATSRTGSPRLHRGDSMRPCTSTQIEATVGSPLPKSGSEESLKSKPDDVTRPSALKTANGRRRKGEPKVRIVTDPVDQSENGSHNSKVAASNKGSHNNNSASPNTQGKGHSDKENNNLL